MKHKPFFFIGNIIKSEINTPIEIKPGFTIKRANSSQIRIIKTRLDRFNDLAHDFLININSYECEFNYTNSDKGYWIEHIKQESNWNYWVLELDCNFEEYQKNQESLINSIRVFDRSFLISELELQMLWGFTHYHISENEIYVDGISSYDYRPLNYFKNQGTINTQKTILTSYDIEDLKELITMVESILNNKNYIQFHKVLNDFINYYEIPPKSSFRIIGLFAILEHLLTSPESSKSINKQLQTKLNLLNNRFVKKIDIVEFFKISNEFKFEKIIEKLYAYRSDIAHGNNIDFENKLQVLNNHELVEEFLISLVKKVLRQSIYEPDLIIDLKKC